MSSEFKPYADDSKVLNMGDLSVENGTDYILFTGSLEIPKDTSSLPRIEKLIDLLSAMKSVITALDN